MRARSSYRRAATAIAMLSGLALLSSAGHAQIIIHAPDGREVHVKGGTPQPDLSAYRSPLVSKIVDRRWRTNDGMYLANESNNTGLGFFLEAVKAGFPVAHNEQFAWITIQESYWYSRYILSNVYAQSHLGVSMVHGPYWTLKARELYEKNRLQRDRGERMPSNKDVLIGNYLPLFYKRTGFPRVFDDAAPTYLQYASGDPHFTGPIDVEDTFADPMSGQKGNWGVPRYYIDWRNTRWDHDDMEVAFDLGGIAQTVKKQLVWVEYFFHSDHTAASPSDPFRETLLLGNDAEEGFRGVMLTFAGFNSLLEAKAALFYDPASGSLSGIDPRSYDPRAGVRYLPHRIVPSMMYVGDLPERVWALDRVPDDRSLLWDQASWIWATSEYEWLAVRFDGKAFTDNPPVDAGIIERSTVDVAQGLSNVLVQNLEAMHARGGVLVSEWTSKNGTGRELRLQDAAMALVALQELIDRRFTAPAPARLGPSDIPERAGELLRATADFLLRVQGADGGFRPAYDVASGAGAGDADLASPNWWAIRALTSAFYATEDARYAEAARRAFDHLNRRFWVPEHGLYRSRAGDDTVLLTPLEVGAATGALRELMFITPLHELEPLIERFTRWFVQTRNTSGMQMSEDNRTGELDYGRRSADEDGDGIPFLAHGHGRYGIAPLPASLVAVNVGDASNRTFAELKGELYEPERFGPVRFAWAPDPAPRRPQLGAAIATSLTYSGPKTETVTETAAEASAPLPALVARQPMQRFNGTVIPLVASRPIARGSDLGGAEIYRRNCAVCHGARGQGITGLPLMTVAAQGADAVFEVPKKGRFEQAMPPWGQGADALAGVLTDEELRLVAEFIANELFRTDAARASTSGAAHTTTHTNQER